MAASDIIGVRIWLSGSIPEGTSPENAERIRQFVRRLAEEVFRLGGTIVHGWHPTMLEPLKNAAQGYKAATHARAPIEMFVSKWFSEEPGKNQVDLPAWNELCAQPVTETRRAMTSSSRTEDELRSMSLVIMRQEIVSRCQAIVAIGGKWWTIARDRSGVSEEISLAAASNLPMFLLGGMGGTVEGLLKNKPELLRNFANGLSLEQNEKLAAEMSPESAARQVVDQLQNLPLRAVAAKEAKPFRVLCLDGGGIRGAYTAAALAYWEKALNLNQPGGPRLIDRFDLISGTSTGGIIAIGLALGMSAEQMLGFYVQRGTRIFGSGRGLNKWWHSTRHWFTSKFDQNVLRSELQTAYASSPAAKSGKPQTQWLDAPPCKLVIPAYNTEIDKPHLFRTPYGRFQHTDRGNDPVIVALSTAAAPTYFTPVESRGAVADITNVDGGIWANCPVSVAIAEAVAELNIPIERIRVLSVGTTYTSQLKGQPMQLDGRIIGAFVKQVVPKPWGFVVGKLVSACWPKTSINGVVGWASNIAGLLMKAQAQTADHLGLQLLGDRYVRIDSPSSHGELDDVTQIKHFASLGEHEAQLAQNFARVQALFLS